TGTTQDNSDGWFVGITPNLVTGCWVGADDPRVHFRTTTLGQGAYMALPIVGKFFHKTYNDSRYAHLKNASFSEPGEELLAMLNEPGYREVLDLEKREFDLASIFKKKDKEAELGKREKARVQREKEKGQIWKKIKNIFRKKENRQK
ncbi:MAG: peptidoglycan glycosyltransferase, partial [Draconibacterium sp.]|nr:peptidoglycan glycosyltransferase [Draconibacterium sp.]